MGGQGTHRRSSFLSLTIENSVHAVEPDSSKGVGEEVSADGPHLNHPAQLGAPDPDFQTWDPIDSLLVDD